MNKLEKTEKLAQQPNKKLFQHGGRIFAFVVILGLIPFLGILKALATTIVFSGVLAIGLNLCIPALRKSKIIEVK